MIIRYRGLSGRNRVIANISLCNYCYYYIMMGTALGTVNVDMASRNVVGINVHHVKCVTMPCACMFRFSLVGYPFRFRRLLNFAIILIEPNLGWMSERKAPACFTIISDSFKQAYCMVDSDDDLSCRSLRE
jgi:hypothetical protein